jgi:hypothetical protein
VRPERCWPLMVGVFWWTGMLAGGVPAHILWWVRGPAGRRLIASHTSDASARAAVDGLSGALGL